MRFWATECCVDEGDEHGCGMCSESKRTLHNFLSTSYESAHTLCDVSDTSFESKRALHGHFPKPLLVLQTYRPTELRPWETDVPSQKDALGAYYIVGYICNILNCDILNRLSTQSEQLLSKCA